MTMVETLLALAIMGAGVSAAVTASAAFRRLEHRLAERRELTLRLSTAAALLRRDLRQASARTENPLTAPGDDTVLLDFTLGDGMRVRYEKTGRPGAIGLVRLDGAGARAVLLENLLGVRVQLWDGTAWRDTWGWDVARHAPYRGRRGVPPVVCMTMTPADGAPRRVTAPVFAALLGAHAP